MSNSIYVGCILEGLSDKRNTWRVFFSILFLGPYYGRKHICVGYICIYHMVAVNEISIFKFHNFGSSQSLGGTCCIELTAIYQLLSNGMIRDLSTW